jgi:hypothetical protein
MFTVYPISLIDMGNELKVWKCHLCNEIHIIRDKFKYCTCCDYKPKEIMNEKNTALQLLEKFSTKRDALIAIDMMLMMYISIKGKEDIFVFFYEDVKREIMNLNN